MKRILLIATGGTIASRRSDNGLKPSLGVKEIIARIPEKAKICRLEGIDIMSVDSTNMNPARMAEIAEAIRDHYDDYDGFVVSHGTDTMAYTAAALTYMLKNLAKPVVLTGSQYPIEEKDTDAVDNLSDAIRFSCENLAGVYLTFGGLLIKGNCAVKIKTVSKDAFASINCEAVAGSDKAVVFTKPEVTGTFHIKTELCQDVFVVKLFPGIGTEIFDFLKNTYKGVIIEGFGSGGIPGENNDIVAKVHELVEAGLAVVITTQCLYDGINLATYEVGRKLDQTKIIIGAKLTTEALTMKLMWALANCGSVAEVKEYMVTRIS